MASSWPVINTACGANQVVPGARVPADGVIVDGRSHVDESMVTGESIPAAKRPGDAVIGGTVNCGAPLIVKVRAPMLPLHAVQRISRSTSRQKPSQSVAGWEVNIATSHSRMITC